MKALLVDDHSLVRHGLDMLLTMRLNFDEVLHAETGGEAMAAIEASEDLNIVLLDYNLGEENGLDVLARIRARRPELVVAIMSGQNNLQPILKSLGEGAAGYIPKSLTPAQLASAIETILAGDIYVPEVKEMGAADQIKHAVEQAQERMTMVAELARRVVREKNFSHRIQGEEGCEISSAFNSLLEELEQDRNRLEAMAFSDPLTGLANRRLFIDRAEVAIKHARRNKNLMALVYLDVDFFKQLNDAHGHESGDLLLKEIARRLVQSVREVDTVARLGGDEFTLVLLDIETHEQVQITIKRIFSQLSAHVTLANNIELTPSLSMGVAISNGNEELRTLMKRADDVMYRVKFNGKNHYIIE